MIVELETGQRLELPDGSNPAQVSEAIDHFHSLQQPKNTGEDKGTFAAGVQGFNSSVPFGNRITATLGAAANYPIAKLAGSDVSYGELYDTARANQKATEEAHPAANTVGSVGGIVSSLPLWLSTGGAANTTPVIGKVADALQKANAATAGFIGGGSQTGAIGKALSVGGRSAVVSAPIGAIYGYGAGEEGKRAEDALQSAALSGGIGFAIPATTSLIGSTYRAIRGNAPDAEKFDVAFKKVYDSLRKDYPEDEAFNQAVNSFASKQGVSLAEKGGKNTAKLAEKAALFEGGNIPAQEFFAEKIGNAPEALKTSISKTISQVPDYYGTLDNIVEQGRKQAAPIYKEAFKNNKSIQSPLLDKILQTPEGKSSLGEAVKNIQNEMSLVAKPDPELTALAKEVSDLGLMEKPAGGVASGLKLKAYDYVKRAMDSSIRTAYRSGNEAEGARLTSLKNAMVGELDRLDRTGLYAKARSTSGDYITAKNAMESGANILRDDRELVARNWQSFSPSERVAYKAGVKKALYDKIESISDGRNVATLFNNPANRAKFQSILPAKEFSKIIDDAHAADNLFKLRNQVLGGSRTAERALGAVEFGTADQEIINNIANRGIKNTAYGYVTNLIQRQFSGVNDRTAKQVADMLYATSPKEKYQLAKALLNQSKAGNKSATQGLRAFYGIEDARKPLPYDLGNKYLGGEAPSLKNLLKDQSGAVPESVTLNPNFRKWFGNSKVVDEQGKPLVVYHGTNKDFDAFKPTQGRAFADDYGNYFFTNNKSEASSYALGEAQLGAKPEGANVKPVYLTLKKPHEVYIDSNIDPTLYFDEQSRLLRGEAKELGSDGIIVENSSGEKLFVAFSPNQIKSAIGNSGKFDPANPSITGSVKINPAITAGGLAYGAKEYNDRKKNKALLQEYLNMLNGAKK